MQAWEQGRARTWAIGSKRLAAAPCVLGVRVRAARVRGAMVVLPALMLTSACAAPSSYRGVSLTPGAADPALQTLAARAQRGDKQAQLDLGIRYEEGKGTVNESDVLIPITSPISPDDKCVLARPISDSTTLYFNIRRAGDGVRLSGGKTLQPDEVWVTHRIPDSRLELVSFAWEKRCVSCKYDLAHVSLYFDHYIAANQGVVFVGKNRISVPDYNFVKQYGITTVSIASIYDKKYLNNIGINRSKIVEQSGYIIKVPDHVFAKRSFNAGALWEKMKNYMPVAPTDHVKCDKTPIESFETQ